MNYTDRRKLVEELKKQVGNWLDHEARAVRNIGRNASLIEGCALEATEGPWLTQVFFKALDEALGEENAAHEVVK